MQSNKKKLDLPRPRKVSAVNNEYKSYEIKDSAGFVLKLYKEDYGCVW